MMENAIRKAHAKFHPTWCGFQWLHDQNTSSITLQTVVLMVARPIVMTVTAMLYLMYFGHRHYPYIDKHIHRHNIFIDALHTQKQYTQKVEKGVNKNIF